MIMKKLIIASMARPVKVVLIAGIAAILILAFTYQPGTASSTNTFIAVLNGGQEVPPNAPPNPSSNALGVAHMTFSEGTSMLCYSISFTTLTTLETAAHFHGPAPAGVNAGILFGISPPPSPSPLGSPKTGCVGPLSEQDEEFLEDGLLYINVHSTMFPGGEIRGQVLPIESD